MTFLITECHIPERNLSVNFRHRHGIRRIFDEHLLVNRLENPFQIRNRRQQRIIKTRQRIDGIPETADICSKSGQHTHCNSAFSAVQHIVNADNVYERSRHRRNDIHTRPHQKLKLDGTHPCLPVASAQIIENIRILLFPRKGLRDSDAVNALRNIGIQIRLLIALNLPGPALFLFDQHHNGR